MTVELYVKELLVKELIISSATDTMNIYLIKTDLHLYSHYAVLNDLPLTFILVKLAILYINIQY